MIERGDIWWADLGPVRGSRPAKRRHVFLPAGATGLSRDSVVDVTQLYTIDKEDLLEPAGLVAGALLTQIDQGRRRVLGL